MRDATIERDLDDLDGWLAADAVAESVAERRAITRATLQRVRAAYHRQLEELARLRESLGRALDDARSIQVSSVTMRAESARLRSERNAAREEAAQLRGALTSRVVIEQAKGMIAAQRGIDVDQAFQRLRKHARDHNARIHDLAAQVVMAGLLI